MKKFFAAAVLLIAMTACGGKTQDKMLIDSKWKLTRMDAIPTESINREADFFTIEFNSVDTMIAGRTNCNRFFGKYELKGTKLEFGGLGMTRMACPEMEYESAFVRMLDEVDRFVVKDDELTFYDGEQMLAMFRAVGKESAK